MGFAIFLNVVKSHLLFSGGVPSSPHNLLFYLTWYVFVHITARDSSAPGSSYKVDSSAPSTATSTAMAGVRSWCDPALRRIVHSAPGAAAVVLMAAEAACFALRQGCFCSFKQPALLLHLHSQWEHFLPAQSSSAPLPAEHPDVDTVWLSAQRAALTKRSVAVSLSSRDNGIFKICGLGREFAWFLNRMAGLGCDTVSSETHFKTELFFFVLTSVFVCKYRISISWPDLLQISVLVWLKGIQTQKLPSGS